MALDEHLQTIRHSCAHVMAQAVLKLFPGTKIAIGPAIDNGFYYDFEFTGDKKISEADFADVEKEMRKILAGNHDFIRKEVSKAEALEIFKIRVIKLNSSTNFQTTKLSPHTLRTLSLICAADHMLQIQKKSTSRVLS